MRECFIIVHRNYAEGMTAYAFLDEDDAKKNVKEDVEATIKSLTEEGHDPTVLWNNWDSVEIYVADSNIFYEWEIIISQIR